MTNGNLYCPLLWFLSMYGSDDFFELCYYLLNIVVRLHCNVCNIAKGNGLCKVYRFIYAPTPHAYPPSLPTYPIPSQVISLWRECRTMGPLCESITNRCQLFPLLTMGHVIILYSLTNCMFYQPLFYYLPSRTFNSVVFQSSSNVK